MELKKVVRGYLISSKQRGEKGSLLLILTKNSLIQVLATNGNKVGGKNIPVGSIVGSLCDFDLAYKGESETGVLMLRNISIVSNFGNFASDLPTSLFFMLVSESIDELLIDDQDDAQGLLLVYQRALEILKEKKSPLGAFSLFLSKSFEFLGFEPETAGCVNCSRTDHIVSFSFEEGGFLCESCSRELLLNPLPRKELLTYKYLFQTPLEDCTPEKIDTSILISVCSSMVSFLKNDYGARLETFSLFISSLK